MRADVTYIFDAGFLVPSLVSAFSLLTHAPEDITVRFLTTEDIAALPAAVARLRRAFPGAEVQERRIDFDATLRVRGHVSPATFARLKLPELLDEPTLYLDGDTLVRHDVRPLFTVDLDGKPVAAVRDAGIVKALHQRDSGMWFGSRKSRRHLRDMGKIADLIDLHSYINAGVMLFDLPRIRALGLDKPMGDAASAVALRDRHGLRFNDQNWLNIVFRGQIHLLPPEWNALWGNRLTGRRPFPLAERRAYAGSRSDPALVHFTGRLRPWEVRFPWLHPKRQPWLSDYKSVETRARELLDL